MSSSAFAVKIYLACCCVSRVSAADGTDLLGLFLAPLLVLLILCALKLRNNCRSTGTDDVAVSVTYLSSLPQVGSSTEGGVLPSPQRIDGEWGAARSPREKFTMYGGSVPAAYRSVVCESPVKIVEVAPLTEASLSINPTSSYRGCAVESSKGLGLAGRKCH